MNSKLFKYEENYFNCRNSQFISFLRAKDVPVDYYFYNCFENTEDLYKHLFIEKKNRWLYESSSMSQNNDYHLLSVDIVEQRYLKYQAAKEHMAQLLEEGTHLFVWLCNYYIPHREHYKRYRSFHSFIVDKLVKDEAGTQYIVTDPPSFHGKINEELIKKAFTATPALMRGITYIDYSSYKVDTEMIMDKYKEWISSFSDDFTTYQHIQALIENFKFEDIEKYMYFFAILFGSRMLFSRFLNVMFFDQALVYTCAECSEIAESIHSVLKNYLVNKIEMDINWIVNQISVLIEKEKQLIHTLKSLN